MTTAKRYLNPGFPFVNVMINDTFTNVIPNYLVRFEHSLLMEGAAGTTKLTLFDPDFDTVENLVIAGKASGNVQFWYGWRNPDGTEGASSAVYNASILTYAPKFDSTGATFELEIVDRVVNHLQGVDSRAFPTSQYPRVSDIVSELVAFTGLKVDHIEPTKKRGGDDLRMEGVTFAHFIQNTLVPLAISDKDGRAGYKFTTIGDRVTFAPIDYDKGVLREYVFARDPNGEVISFEPQFQGALMFMQGGGKIRCEGFDPINNPQPQQPGAVTQGTVTKNIDINTPDLNNVALNDKVPDLPENVADGLTGRIYSLPFTNPTDVDAWAKWKFTIAREGIWMAKLEIIGDPTIYPRDIVRVLVIKTDGDLHYTSGNYIVRRVINTITQGEFKTVLELSTDSSRKGDLPNKGIKKQLALIASGEKRRDDLTDISSVPESSDL